MSVELEKDTPRSSDVETVSSDGPSGLLVLIALLVVACAISLHTVKHPGELVIASSNPTPFGYTWSLCFFLIPISAVFYWVLFHHPGGETKKAFGVTIAILAPLGFLLDIFFGLLFFNFPNVDATTQIHLYAYDWSAHGFTKTLPIEEFGFYLFGFLAILSGYLWFSESYMSRYRNDDLAGHAKKVGHLLKFHWGSVLIGLGLAIGSLMYKKLVAHPYQEGFPGWMWFLIMIGLVPAMGLYKSTRDLVNWRALTMTVALMTLVSIVWEANLAVPYGWWGYEDEQMMGIFIHAWSGLPIEQPFLWVLISITTAIVYETIRLLLHGKSNGRGARSMLLGDGN